MGWCLLLSGGLLLFGRVHAGGGGNLGRLGRAANEPFGVGLVGGVKDDRALDTHCVGVSVVDVGGCVQAQDAVGPLLWGWLGSAEREFLIG
jgi:hypothetical protein